LPFSAAAGGIRVRLRVQPKARRDRIDGPAPEPDGGVALKVAVTAAPEDGRANAAVIALLADAWKLPKSRFTLLSGATGRHKTIHLQGDPQRLMQTLGDWLRNTETAP